MTQIPTLDVGLINKIELEPVGRGRERGYRFRGVLCIERLIGGEA
jgi:hypothetical protein